MNKPPTDTRKPKKAAVRSSSAAVRGPARPQGGVVAPRHRDTKSQPPGGERIAKAIARAGLCSRREAERWIAAGRVSVNGKVLDTPAFEVGPRDSVVVDGEPLPVARDVILWRYYKPRGCVTTHSDPEGRPTVFEALPAQLGRVISAGRLDFNTEGLLLLTTSGALARHLELPATGLLRRYRVRARGLVTQQVLDGLKEGIEVEGVRYGPIEATLDESGGSNVWLTVGLREGKNREVRKILEHLGLEVGRLIRVSYGPFRLQELKPGEVEQVRRKVLAEQLGPKLAAELGLSEADEPTAPARRPVGIRPTQNQVEAPSVKAKKKPGAARGATQERLIKRGTKWVRRQVGSAVGIVSGARRGKSSTPPKKT